MGRGVRGVPARGAWGVLPAGEAEDPVTCTGRKRSGLSQLWTLWHRSEPVPTAPIWGSPLGVPGLTYAAAPLVQAFYRGLLGPIAPDRRNWGPAQPWPHGLGAHTSDRGLPYARSWWCGGDFVGILTPTVGMESPLRWVPVDSGPGTVAVTSSEESGEMLDKPSASKTGRGLPGMIPALLAAKSIAPGSRKDIWNLNCRDTVPSAQGA